MLTHEISFVFTKNSCGNFFKLQSQPDSGTVCHFPYSFRSFALQISLLAAMASNRVPTQVVILQGLQASFLYDNLLSAQWDNFLVLRGTHVWRYGNGTENLNKFFVVMEVNAFSELFALFAKLRDMVFYTLWHFSVFFCLLISFRQPGSFRIVFDSFSPVFMVSARSNFPNTGGVFFCQFCRALLRLCPRLASWAKQVYDGRHVPFCRSAILFFWDWEKVQDLEFFWFELDLNPHSVNPELLGPPIAPCSPETLPTIFMKKCYSCVSCVNFSLFSF